MNSMDEDELGEVGPISRLMHVPSPHNNIGMVNHFHSTLSGSSINLSQSPSRLSIPLSPSSLGTDSTSDVLDLANLVLTWESYDEFCNFCSKIGLSFNSRLEAEIFLNTVRSQPFLPPVNLGDMSACIELFRVLSVSPNF